MAKDKSQTNAFRVLTLCIFMAMIGLGIITPIIPNYASELGATGVMIGLIYSSFSLSRAILQIPIGRMADNYSKKKIIVIGLGLYTITSVLYTYVNSPEALIAVRFFHGIGSATVLPVAMSYAIELTPEGEEGRYMGYMNTALFSGYAFGPLLGGFIYENYSTLFVFYAMSVLVSISLLLTGLVVPEEKSLGMHLDRPKISFRKIITNRKLRGAFVYRAVNSMGISTIMGFLPLFAIQVLNISGTTIGFILSAGIFATALLQSPMGILADRFNKKLMLIAGGLISSTGYFYIIYTQNITELFISRLLVTAGGALSIPAITTIIAEEGKKLGSGSTMGIYNTAMSVGRIVGPIFIGFLLDTYGMSAVFNFTGVIGIISILAFYLFSRGNN